MKVTMLNGIWQIGWEEIGKGTPERAGALCRQPYSVPGDVHTPLIEAGVIPEPLYGRNSLDCRWMEDQEYWCRREFVLAEGEILPVMRLTFEGLDCTADVYLNGHYVGRSNNAFVEVTWDVGQYLQPGENALLVRIDQGLVEAKTHELERMGTMWNNDQPWRVWMRKPQYVYSWDWTIWLASCGIWKDVYLTGYDSGILSDIYARSLESTPGEGMPCRVAVSVETERIGDAPCGLVCRITDREGRTVAAAEQVLTAQAGELELVIPEAHLWWCNGMGEAYLYTVEVELRSGDGRLLDSRTQRLGIRTIDLTEPQMANGESGFLFVLNGQPVFCKGANHVPCDCLPGRITPERERKLVELARDSHMNMLRIWGGGVYASETMMKACDEAGILVWHDFMYACGYYPDHDPGFVASISDEARKAICRLRRHTSLIGWAGNNEIQEMYHCQKRWDPELPWYGGRIYEEILPALVAELCPSLVYRQSSPFGGAEQADCRHGDQHIWVLTHVSDHPHYLDLWRFTDFNVKFFSEFGVLGAMTMETAQSCIPEEHLHSDDPVWLHHTNTSVGGKLQDMMVEKYFGRKEWSFPQYTLRSQAIQSEITRHMYEEFRRRKEICSGLLFWTLGDSYGVHNWSLIDYQLRRKPIYHSLKQAMAPLALCIRGWDVQTDEGRKHWRTHWAEEPGKLELWGMNDTLQSQNARLTWTMLTRTGRVLLEDGMNVQIPANRSVHLTDVSLADVPFRPEDAVFRARLTVEGETVNESKYFFAPFEEMIPGEGTVSVDCGPAGENRWEVTLTADQFCWMAHLAEPDGTVYSENDFDLWPGEPRTITVTTDDPAFVPVLHLLKKEDAPCK